MPAAPHHALRYSSDIETPLKGEADIETKINQSMHSILQTTFNDYGHAVRSVHAKSHALLEGKLTVLPNLPEVLAQGVFARVQTHPVVLRFSTNPGDVLDDSVSAPRGLAIKQPAAWLQA